MDEGQRHGRSTSDSGLQWVEFQLPGLEGDAFELRLGSDHNDLSAQRLARRWDGAVAYPSRRFPSRASFVTHQAVGAGTEPTSETDDASRVDLAIVHVTRTPRSPWKRRRRTP